MPVHDSRVKDPSLAPDGSTMLLYVPEGVSGFTVPDRSGHGNDGTLSGVSVRPGK